MTIPDCHCHGVSVVVKGTTNGTVTDQQGNYKIEVSPEDKILVFTMIGYTTVSEKIGERSLINVVMKVVDLALDEIVVIGSGTKKERSSEYFSMAAPTSAAYGAKHFFQQV